MQKTKLNSHEMFIIAKNGLIGFEAEIVNASDRSLMGLKGKIIDETLKTITLETRNGRKIVPKDIVTLSIAFPDGKVIVNGKDLLQRPEERIKKWWRKIKRGLSKWKRHR